MALEGLPKAAWGVTETTEAAQYQQKAGLQSSGAGLRFELPARSLVTLTSKPAAANSGN